jgi:RP/EB family microtubule-associated protein
MANRVAGKNASSVGMMEGAFFVGRTELLDWVNNLLCTNLDKVEQCASGAVYCQIVDACYPGTVKMSKVNWMAKVDHEFIPNYKILQAAFDRNHIEKHIDVDKLVRAKYQDNLEFLQWTKALWDREAQNGVVYDAAVARQGKSMQSWAQAKAPVNDVSKENLTANRRVGAAKDGKFEPAVRRQPASSAPKAAPQRAPAAQPRPGTKVARPTADAAELEELKCALQERDEEIAHGQEERDFYFQKLRNIEILCATVKANMNADPPIDTETVASLLANVEGILFNDDPEEQEAQLSTPVREEDGAGVVEQVA